MTTTVMLTLQGDCEKVAPQGSYPEYLGTLLYHQLRTWHTLRDHDVVVNTYNTGTGKTRAALLRLMDLDRQGVNVLFIAPTNELISQHVRDIEQFVNKHHLDYYVRAVTAPDIRALGSGLRSGEKLYRLFRNYLEFEERATRRQAMIVVTNPDIFYYALYFRYGLHDQRNVFGEVIGKFDYIVVDEFHYYNNKQLANFLFAFALFDQFGYFGHPDHQRRVCLLSATPRTNVLYYLYKLFGQRLALVAPNNEPPESQDYNTIPTLAPLHLSIRAGSLSEWIEQAANQVTLWVKDESLDGAIISNSLGRVNEAFDHLKRTLGEALVGRITGPEPPAN
jgi:CRISPR-associated endonuclease/helicase Cas3